MKQKHQKLLLKEINKKLVIENLKEKFIDTYNDFNNIIHKCLKN